MADERSRLLDVCVLPTSSMEFLATGGHNLKMTSVFLTQLADQLKRGKNPTQRRAIQSALLLVTARFEAGRYRGQVDAESELHELVEQAHPALRFR